MCRQFPPKQLLECQRPASQGFLAMHTPVTCCGCPRALQGGELASPAVIVLPVLTPRLSQGGGDGESTSQPISEESPKLRLMNPSIFHVAREPWVTTEIRAE